MTAALTSCAPATKTATGSVAGKPATVRGLFRETRDAVRATRRQWWLITLMIPVLYYIGMLIALMVRFQDLPNYVNFYDYPGNILQIIELTPSVKDMIPIMLEEWLIEIGYLNTDFGAGISEWSLNILPAKVAVILILSALVATNISLLSAPGKACSKATQRGATTATGLGAGFVGVTSLTMSWVVCCATPTWVVGLAMLGVGVSTSLYLEFLGPWLSAAGFGLLGLSTVVLAWLRSRPDSPRPVSAPDTLRTGDAV